MRFVARQRGQGLVIWGPRDPPFGHNRGDVLRRGDVKCRILHPHSFRSNRLAGNVRYLSRTPLLDGNLAAVWRRKINGGNRSGYVKGDIVFLRQHRDRVSANLVGDVSVGGNAVSTYDYRA